MMLVFSILKVKGLLQPRNITLLSSSCDNNRFSRRRPKVSKLAPLTGRGMILDEMSNNCIVI